jgi:hypothetical protein
MTVAYVLAVGLSVAALLRVQTIDGGVFAYVFLRCSCVPVCT